MDREVIKLPAQEWLGYDPERGDIHGYTFEQMREFAESIVKQCASPSFCDIDHVSAEREGGNTAILESEATLREQPEIYCEELGIQARVHYEDPRYPTLILEGTEFGAVGYSLNLETGDLARVCLCAARSSGECICGAWA